MKAVPQFLSAISASSPCKKGALWAALGGKRGHATFSANSGEPNTDFVFPPFENLRAARVPTWSGSRGRFPATPFPARPWTLDLGPFSPPIPQPAPLPRGQKGKATSYFTARRSPALRFAVLSSTHSPLCVPSIPARRDSGQASPCKKGALWAALKAVPFSPFRRSPHSRRSLRSPRLCGEGCAIPMPKTREKSY